MSAIETAAFAAWPSAVSMGINGWQLRLDRGYTKRANSLNATEHSQALSDADLDAVEQQFHSRGLISVVRLISCSAVPHADAWLAGRGYAYCDLSYVMTRRLSDSDGSVSADANASAGTSVATAHPGRASDAAQWLAAFHAVSQKSSADHATHLDILQRIQHLVAWAVHAQADAPAPVCCGIGVLVNAYLGLFDIATHAAHRRQGLAQELCRGILAWGRERGAHTAFLQVVAANTNAIRAYERLGFHVAYSYWYRVKASP